MIRIRMNLRVITAR